MLSRNFEHFEFLQNFENYSKLFKIFKKFPRNLQNFLKKTEYMLRKLCMVNKCTKCHVDIFKNDYV